mmetsp:Transcript_61217/g.167992  ORF Transcript_61217/g.167992 Transcript_61217/m.167992 type:complete len:152 (-) Transcript_61217:39-494(-)
MRPADVDSVVDTAASLMLAAAHSRGGVVRQLQPDAAAQLACARQAAIAKRRAAARSTLARKAVRAMAACGARERIRLEQLVRAPATVDRLDNPFPDLPPPRPCTVANSFHALTPQPAVVQPAAQHQPASQPTSHSIPTVPPPGSPPPSSPP